MLLLLLLTRWRFSRFTILLLPWPTDILTPAPEGFTPLTHFQWPALAVPRAATVRVRELTRVRPAGRRRNPPFAFVSFRIDHPSLARPGSVQGSGVKGQRIFFLFRLRLFCHFVSSQWEQRMGACLHSTYLSESLMGLRGWCYLGLGHLESTCRARLGFMLAVIRLETFPPRGLILKLNVDTDPFYSSISLESFAILSDRANRHQALSV